MVAMVQRLLGDLDAAQLNENCAQCNPLVIKKREARV